MVVAEQIHELLESPGRNTHAGFGLQAIRAKAALVLTDLFVLALAIAAAAMLRPEGADAVVGAGALALAFPIAMAKVKLYSARFLTRRSDEVRRIWRAALGSGAAVAVMAYMFDLEINQIWLCCAVGFAAVGLTIERELLRHRFDAMRRSGKMSRRVILLGDNGEADAFAEMFAADPALGYMVSDVINPDAVADPNLLAATVIERARELDASGVVVAASSIDLRASNRVIRDVLEAGLHVELSSTLADITPDRLTVRPLGRFPVMYIEPVVRNGWRAGAKRAFDLSASLLGLALLSPVLVGLALWVRFDSKGPVVFRQSRVGRNGEPFEVCKFRTMVTNAEDLLVELEANNEGAGPLFKMKEDPRVTRAGRFLRKTSLDELPQLWNVVRGEMSLVGPRPALAKEMADWDADLYNRLRVKPGITGMWQVSGRSETTFEEYTRLDLYYVDNWSLLVDLSILAKTVPAVLASDGAY